MKQLFPKAIVENGVTIGFVDRVVSLAPWAALDPHGRQMLRFQSRTDAVAEVRRAWRERH